MKKNDGGPAFARPRSADPEEFHKPEAYHAQEGMSLRAYIATKCCAAMVSTIQVEADYQRMRDVALAHKFLTASAFMAAESVKQADALIAALEAP